MSSWVESSSVECVIVVSRVEYFHGRTGRFVILGRTTVLGALYTTPITHLVLPYFVYEKMIQALQKLQHLCLLYPTSCHTEIYEK